MKAYSILLQHNNNIICQVFLAIHNFLPKFSYVLNLPSHFLKKWQLHATSKRQAFTNCVHGYNGALNVQTNSVTRAQKFVHSID